MKKSFFMLFAVTMLMMGVSVLQAGTPSQGTRSIVAVERSSQNAPQTLYVSLDVDHADRVYREGDLMKITVKANKPSYLYLLYKNAAGEVSMIFPNQFERNNRIEGGQTLTLPTDAMHFDFITQAPFGDELLQAVVTLQPIKDVQNIAIKSAAESRAITQEELKTVEDCVLGIGVTARQEGAASSSTRNDYADCTLAIKTLPQTAPVPVSKHKRVFIGICAAKYKHAAIPGLPACEKDIRAIGQIMSSSCGVDRSASRVYINEDVTYHNIHELFFDYLPKITNPGDEIIIYWTGHGARCADTNGDEADGKDETLVLYDSNPYEPTTQLIDDDFGRWAQNLSGRKVLFILDTCHSEGMNNTAKGLDDSNSSKNVPWDFGFGEVSTMKDLGQRDMAVIASSAASEVSMVRTDGEMSVMTWYVVDYLKTHRRVTHKELAEGIRADVEAYVNSVQRTMHQTVGLQDELNPPMILNP